MRVSESGSDVESVGVVEVVSVPRVTAGMSAQSLRMLICSLTSQDVVLMTLSVRHRVRREDR